jgi:glycosyltransferase involved in cell wall biosynthesis
MSLKPADKDSVNLMRICIVNEFFWPDNTGGTGTVLSQLARAIRANYGDVGIDVLSSRNLYRTPPLKVKSDATSGKDAPRSETGADRGLARNETWNGIRITRIAIPRPNGLPTPLRLLANLMFSYSALLRLLVRPKYDLVLIGTAPPMVALAASIYRSLRGVPFVYAVYDLEPDRAVVLNMIAAGHPAAKLLRSKQMNWFRDASKVVVLGRCMRDYIQAQYNIATDKIAVIPVGADHKDIEPREIDTTFRFRHDLHGFVVLYTGNFGRYHDFDTILNCAKRLSTLRDDIQFVLIGGGWQRQRVADRIATEKISNVLVRPFVPAEDYSDLLASANASLVTLEPGMDGLCVPSKFYSILASGRPTIAVVPPTTEVGLTIEESKCGLRIDHGNVDAMVNAVLTLADNPELAQTMGANARKVLVDKYTTEAAAHAFYDTFVDSTGGSAQSSVQHKPAPITERMQEAEARTSRHAV